MKRKKKTDGQKLRQILQKQDAVKKSVEALLRNLDAKRSFNQNGKTVTEDDAASQVRAAVALLTWAAPQPPKASAKDVEPTSKLSEKEREAEVRRILGVE